MIPAAVCKAVARTKVIHDVVDIWPQALVATGYSLPRMVLSVTKMVSKLSYYFSDSIVTISGSMKETLREIAPRTIPVQVIENCVTEPFFNIPAKEKTSDFNVLYLGTLGPANDFFSIVEAARKMQADDHFRFTIIGSGEQARDIETWLQELNIENITLLNAPINHKDVPKWLSTADVLILPLKKGFGETSLPSKLAEYFASGRPVVCAVDGELATQIKKSQTALVVECGNIEEFVTAIRQLRDDQKLASELSGKAREYAQDHLSSDSFNEKIHNLLELTLPITRD